jgi:hypothetical protein
METDGVVADAPLKPSTAGSSGSFLVLADDKNRYWCKTLNNLQDPRVPVNEQVVARLGVLIGAPVCEPQFVRMQGAVVGWEFRPGSGRRVEEGWAHGSLAVDPCVEIHDVATNRASDDNARRHAGIYALYDWTAGANGQWLMAGDDSTFHSHDHGHYFPGGPAWTVATLQASAASSFALPVPPTGLDETELERLAYRLDALTEQEIAGVMSNLPAEWPVRDEELEALIDFIYGRRQDVAQRLRALVPEV